MSQPFRKKAYTLLHERVGDDTIAKNIEIGAFNATIWKAKKRSQCCSWSNTFFRNMYMNKIRQIDSNLTQESSTKQRLLSGDILPHEIAFMTCHELYPEHWETILAEKKKKDALMCEIDFGQATNQYRCMKCGGNKTTYYTMQTRSADEAETLFITCLNCGKRWRK